MSTTGEPTDPIETFDASHGRPEQGPPKLSEEEAWGTNLNPVRETAQPAKNLQDK
jgi:hypothetical protein